MHTFRPSTKLFLLTLAACALYTPGSTAEGQAVATLGQGGYRYAFLTPPFLIANTWMFTATDSEPLYAATPGALAVKLGAQPSTNATDVMPLYAQIGRLGWELVGCSSETSVAPGFGSPGCIFRKTF